MKLNFGDEQPSIVYILIASVHGVFILSITNSTWDHCSWWTGLIKKASTNHYLPITDEVVPPGVPTVERAGPLLPALVTKITPFSFTASLMRSTTRLYQDKMDIFVIVSGQSFHMTQIHKFREWGQRGGCDWWPNSERMYRLNKRTHMTHWQHLFYDC